MAALSNFFSNLFESAETAPPSSRETTQKKSLRTDASYIAWISDPELKTALISQFPAPLSLTCFDDSASVLAQIDSLPICVLIIWQAGDHKPIRDLIKTLREKRPDLSLQILVIAKDFDREEMIQLLRQRTNGFLSLPFEKESILEVLSNLNFYLPETLDTEVKVGGDS